MEVNQTTDTSYSATTKNSGHQIQPSKSNFQPLDPQPCTYTDEEAVNQQHVLPPLQRTTWRGLLSWSLFNFCNRTSSPRGRRLVIPSPHLAKYCALANWQYCEATRNIKENITLVVMMQWHAVTWRGRPDLRGVTCHDGKWVGSADWKLW